MSLPDLYDKAAFERIGRIPANRKYKYIALAWSFVGIALMLVTIIGIDSFSVKTILILRGYAGVCALFFILFIAIYLFRVYKTLFNQNS